MNCFKCKEDNPDGKKYCGECGASLDPRFGELAAYMETMVQEKTESILAKELKNLKMTEIDIATSVGQRVAGWAKLFASFVGVPLAILLAVLGLLGFDKYQKFQAYVTTKTEQVKTDVESGKKTAEAVKAEAENSLRTSTSDSFRFTKNIKELDDTMSKLKERAGVMDAQLDQIQALKENLAKLNSTVSQLAGTALTVRRLQYQKRSLGVDVSHFQESIDWAAIGREGQSFAFIKATEGTTYVDPLFKGNWNGAKKARLTRGAYHVGVHGDPEVQVARFLATAQLDPGDLAVLDIASAVDSRMSLTEAEQFVTLVHNKINRYPVLYSSTQLLEKFGDLRSSILSNCPLWLVKLGPAPPTPPQPWRRWTFWQFSNIGTVSGIGAVDLNSFNGSVAELLAFTRP